MKAEDKGFGILLGMGKPKATEAKEEPTADNSSAEHKEELLESFKAFNTASDDEAKMNALMDFIELHKLYHTED